MTSLIAAGNRMGLCVSRNIMRVPTRTLSSKPIIEISETQVEAKFRCLEGRVQKLEESAIKTKQLNETLELKKFDLERQKYNDKTALVIAALGIGCLMYIWRLN